MASSQSIELARRGQEVYDRTLRDTLEASNANDFVAVEPESGDYFLGRTMSEAVAAARAAQPDRLSFVVRIGHRAAIHLGVLVPQSSPNTVPSPVGA